MEQNQPSHSAVVTVRSVQPSFSIYIIILALYHKTLILSLSLSVSILRNSSCCCCCCCLTRVIDWLLKMAASAYPSVNAVQVGSYFVGQYYQVLQQHPDLVHQFYAGSSNMTRIDAGSTESANTMLQIHALVMSLNLTAIEIKTINSLDSWNGGVLVMVSGSVKTKDFVNRRIFVQTFFLAPQEKGYYVLNDIFLFVDDGAAYQQDLPPENIHMQHPAPISSDETFDAQLDSSNPLPEAPVSDYVLEEEARECVNSVRIDDDPVDKYSLPEQQHQEDLETEIVVEETPVDETAASFQAAVNAVQDFPTAAPEEPLEEPPKKTYASILQVSKGQFSSSGATQPPVNKSAPTTSDWNHMPTPTAQQPESVLSSAPESGMEVTEDSLGLDEGELKSVYVRNLPSDITAEEIEEEFKHFGRIKPDGVFVRNRKDVVGVCYAFVEFEDLRSVQNAIKASPIQLAGRPVHIEERRSSSSIASRGGRGRGRGRGYQTDAPRGRFGARSLGRGGNQDGGGDYSRARGSGFYQRALQ